MLSSYIWSLGANLELAAKVKGDEPETIVVLGGPSAPKYAGDAGTSSIGTPRST